MRSFFTLILICGFIFLSLVGSRLAPSSVENRYQVTKTSFIEAVAKVTDTSAEETESESLMDSISKQLQRLMEEDHVCHVTVEAPLERCSEFLSYHRPEPALLKGLSLCPLSRPPQA